jgi:pyridoxine 5-phosphate synthase
VNIDHVATLRQARRGREPDPLHGAMLAELGGADQITVHLREDRRHIQDRDLELLRQVVQTSLDMEMAPVAEMVRVATRIRPELATLVPEKREEITTEGGLNVKRLAKPLARVISRLQEGGIRVALFIDPEPPQVLASRKVGAEAIEINTGRFSEARGPGVQGELEKIADAARLGAEHGLRVHAGHGLNYHNIFLVREIREIEECNIGHSIVSRAVLVGLERAVREMRDLLP